MNFLERIFGRKERIEEKPVKIKLKFSELDKWLESETSEFMNTINQTTKESFKQIETVSRQMSNNLEKLEKAEIEEHNAHRLKKLARDNRSAFITKVRMFNNKIKFPDYKKPFHALKFYAFFGNELNKLAMETNKNLHFTNMLFADEVKEITDNLRDLNHIASESRKAMHENKDKLESISAFQENIQEIKNLVSLQKSENEQLNQDKLTLKKLQDEEKEIHQTLDKLNESSELTHFKQAKEQLKILDEQRNKIKDTVLQMFSPLGKALKKYERYAAGFNKDEMKLLAAYINFPFKAVQLDKEFKALNKILENMEKLVNSCKINLKDKQKQKTLIQIDKLKKHSELKNLLAEYEKTQRLTEKSETEIKGIKINREIDSAKQKLTSLGDMIENKKQNIQKLESNLNNSNQAISHKIKELESASKKISGKDVSIRFDSK